MSPLENLKVFIREEDYPMFSDEELQMYLDKNDGNVSGAAYECLIVKSEDTTISVSGLDAPDTSKYFLRLAKSFRPNNSGELKGGF